MTALCAVLLTAGNASRYGRAKLLEPFEGEPLVRRAARAALDTTPSVLVVTGAYADAIQDALRGLPLTLLHHPDWNAGMGSSIAAAFRHLVHQQPQLSAALVCTADVPLVGAAELQRLIAAHNAHPQYIVASELSPGTQGPPCIFPRWTFPELGQLSNAPGARVLLQRHATKLVTVAMPEAAVDVDTPEDYQRLLAAHLPKQH